MEQFVRLFKKPIMISLYLLAMFQQGRCDWVSEWLTPLELQQKEDQNIKSRSHLVDIYEPTMHKDDAFQSDLSTKKDFTLIEPVRDYSMNMLKMKLESTLGSAEELATSLKKQIVELEAKEITLKEAIVYGKSGATTLTVTGADKSSRSYIIRDGFWTLCSGMIQSPISAPLNILSEVFSSPRCIGQEIPTVHDPCAFNSIIKYETIPTVRRSLYQEDDYLCLKSNFNNSMEHYASVPKSMVKDTCIRGAVKTLSENIANCGERILLDYTYYPNGNYLAIDLPLEYCTGDDGSCKLLVAWYLSNTTIENFDILSDDTKFKKTFMQAALRN